MTTPSILAPTRPGAAASAGLGICLSGVIGTTFGDRREPLYCGDVQIAQEMLEANGLGHELEGRLSHRGNSFIAMGEDLLRQAGDPAPRADAVVLAYQQPDLHTPDVAGCYFADRLAGSPVPLSIDEQGPGAAFTALRVIDAAFRLGELRSAALFAIDQNAAIWEEDAEVQKLPDSAVLLLLAATGAARVAEITELATADPAAALAALLRRRPGARALVGASMLGRLGDLAEDERIVPASGSHLFTAAWMSLARLWPLAGPVIVTDFHDYTSRLYTCLLVPRERP